MGAGAVVLVQEVLSPAAQWCSRDNMRDAFGQESRLQRGLAQYAVSQSCLL